MINGDRRGLNWGAGGGWQDGTAGVWPDWLEVQFNGPQLIEQIDVFSVQDNYTAPTVPTLSMTFTKYGLQDFAVEYWTGSTWQAVPGGSVLNNTSVWREFHFAPVMTPRIRVWVTRALGSRSRLIEVEAYAVWGSVNEAPTVTLTRPAPDSAFPVATPVVLEATATDVDGAVSQVDFYANGSLVGTDTTPQTGVFAATFAPALAGTFHDNRGCERRSRRIRNVVSSHGDGHTTFRSNQRGAGG